MRRTTVKVQNVSKVYRMYNNSKERFLEAVSRGKRNYGKDHYALDHNSFEIQEGDIVGIIGVNGSGKSTLLKIITGVLQPSSGSVEIHGRI